MPKKTKKEKRTADFRHKTFSHPAQEIQSSELQTSHPRYQFVATTQQKRQLADDTHELTAIRLDLLKTLLLAIVAITIECILYWKLRM